MEKIETYSVLDESSELKGLRASQILIGKRKAQMQLEAYEAELKIVKSMIKDDDNYSTDILNTEFILLRNHLEFRIRNLNSFLHNPCSY